MKKCWAESYERCGGGISGEHLISQGLFRPSKTVNVQGFTWCADKMVTVGIKSLTRNILCRDHNSALSLLDEAAVETFNVLRRQVRLSRLKTSLLDLLAEKPPTLNGSLLERWFLKTMINLTVEGPLLIGQTGTVRGVPPVDLVEMVYGSRPLSLGMGLSTLVSKGMPIHFREEVEVVNILEADNRLIGSMFSFFGLRFLMWLGDEHNQLSISALQELFPAEWGKVADYIKPLRTLHLKVSPLVTLTAFEITWDTQTQINIKNTESPTSR